MAICKVEGVKPCSKTPMEKMTLSLSKDEVLALLVVMNHVAGTPHHGLQNEGRGYINDIKNVIDSKIEVNTEIIAFGSGLIDRNSCSVYFKCGSGSQIRETEVYIKE